MFFTSRGVRGGIDSVLHGLCAISWRRCIAHDQERLLMVGRHVERNGSGIELRTPDHDYCGVKTLGKSFPLYIAPLHSAV